MLEKLFGKSQSKKDSALEKQPEIGTQELLRQIQDTNKRIDALTEKVDHLIVEGYDKEKDKAVDEETLQRLLSAIVRKNHIDIQEIIDGIPGNEEYVSYASGMRTTYDIGNMVARKLWRYR